MAWLRSPAILGPGRVGGSNLSSLLDLRRCLSPCTHFARPDESSTLAFPVEGYPPTFQASKVPQVKENFRRYQEEGCSFSPTLNKIRVERNSSVLGAVGWGVVSCHRTLHRRPTMHACSCEETNGNGVAGSARERLQPEEAAS